MIEFIMYHNPKCSKSRQTLELLKEKNIKPQIKEYLNVGLTEGEIKNLLSCLDGKASDIVRRKEEDFKSAPFDLNSSEAIIKALIEKPKLLERPIVIKGEQAVIGRPPENVLKLL